MRRKITLSDIARLVGVSPSTVSRALSGAPGVGDELRERIRKVAKELGYVPNMVAKALKKSVSKTVGVVVPDITNPFFVEFLSGLDRVFFSNEYKFIVGNTDEDLGRERKYLEWFLSHGVDGIIASTTAEDGSDNAKLIRDIVKIGIPVVLFDRIPRELEGRLDFVGIDNEKAIEDSLRYLKEMGHSSVGALVGKGAIYTMRKRKEAFREKVEEFSMETREDWILDDLFPECDSVDEISRFLSSRDRPSAVIAFNQSLLRAFLRAAKSAGVKIPDDISVVAFDDSEENDFYAPPISAVRQPAREMGKIAATILLERIAGERSKPARVILSAELVKRESVRLIEASRV